MVDDFKQFSDIDFKDIPQNIKLFFEKSKEYKFYINEINQNVLFRCPNIGSLLDEKIYYYSKYTEFKNLLEERKPITEEGYENLTYIDCDPLRFFQLLAVLLCWNLRLVFENTPLFACNWLIGSRRPY
jgi:hypothetical protein